MLITAYNYLIIKVGLSTEAYTVGSRTKEIEAPAAKERQSTLSNQETASGNFPEASKGDTCDKIVPPAGDMPYMKDIPLLHRATGSVNLPTHSLLGFR